MKKDRIKEISDVNDESGREHKCRIVVDLKRDADPERGDQPALPVHALQITVSMINIALVNRQPRTMGLKEMIQHFIEHRKEVIVRRTQFLLKKAQQRGHILEGLIFAVVRYRRSRAADPLEQDARRSDREIARARLPHRAGSSVGAADSRGPDGARPTANGRHC